MKKSTQKTVLEVAIFATLLTSASVLGNLEVFLPFFSAFTYYLSFLLSICLYIGLFSYWMLSIYKRIMQSHVRNYLMMIGALIIFWVAIRTVKWTAFIFVTFEDRILWYMYYIPMIMLAVFFFFTALCVGENEDYRLNKKWYLLFIPAVLLIIAVLTNDIHGMAFTLDIYTHAYAQDYSHGIIYYIVLVFILSLVLMASIIIISKFSSLKSAKKAAIWPALIIITCLAYSIAYIIKPLYGVGYYIDLTIFGCTMAIALLESFIKTGLIHSNINHSECFAMADIKAQVLSNNGDVVYKSKNALPLKTADFNKLKTENTISVSEGILCHMSPIKGGYVSWNSDVSHIQDMINNLKALNAKLYKEVDILTLENEQKSESARLQKLTNLHNIMLKEILPFSEKIQSEILEKSKDRAQEIKRLLFETSMTSTYIKRKVNLILTQQTEKFISTQELKLCFLESFQLLKLYSKTCVINIINEYDMSLETAILCLDLYQGIIEKTNYNFDAVYITYNLDATDIIFTVQISGDIILSYNELELDKFIPKTCTVQLSDETDSYLISLTMPKSKE